MNLKSYEFVISFFDDPTPTNPEGKWYGSAINDSTGKGTLACGDTPQKVLERLIEGIEQEKPNE
jgi:hypothetical protein